MGYNTQFSIDTIHHPAERYLEAAKAISEDLAYVLEEGDEALKWYDMNDDMKKLSEQFPDEIFVVMGDGEESWDIWRNAYRAGVAYTSTAQITLPEIQLPGMTIKERPYRK